MLKRLSNKIIFSIILIFLISANDLLYAQFPYYVDSKLLDINFLQMENTNYGYTNHYGAIWTHYIRESAVFDQGLFLIGKINGEIYLSEAMWGSLYSPGPIIDGEPAMSIHPEDSLRYRVYKISRTDSLGSSLDVQEWPSQWGAPITFNKNIKLYGDQMLWSIYNGFDSACVVPKRKGRVNYPAFPIEVHQTAFAYKDGDSLDFLQDVIFLEYKIIYKGSVTMDSVYAGMWADIDFYGENNFPAVDTSLQLGYCWSNYTENDPWYDSSLIPAVGYVQLYGPSVYSQGSTSTYMGEKRNDHKNLKLSSFWGFYDDSYPDTSDFGPAYSRNTAWNIARGYDKHGYEIMDTTTGEKTTFRYAGDPVTGTGWLADWHPASGGAGFYIFSGPFNLAPKDTQWVMYALIAARGGDNLRSITELRRRALRLANIDYADLVKFTEIDNNDSPGIQPPEDFMLMQNYPNPFNGKTVIEYALPYRTAVTVDVFDILGCKITELINDDQDAGIHRLSINSGNFASGIYLYRMSTGNFSCVKKMVIIR